MQRKNIRSILEKINSEALTAEEENIARYWIHKLNPKRPSGYTDEDLERVSEEMWGALIKENQIHSVKLFKLWPRIVAAAAVVLIVLGAYFFNHNVNTVGNILVIKDAEPGRSGATLTLSSGKRIKLNDAADGELIKEAGVIITKSATGQLIYTVNAHSNKKSGFNTLSTAKGETYQVLLPDGSLIWLNAASSLTYSANLLNGNKRWVKLQGEAYFEIYKDKTHPFIVETANQEVEVLGTHFNINAYPNEPAIKTTLLEGSVQINHTVLLKPNEQAINFGSGIKVLKVDGNIFTGWKDGVFIFRNEQLGSVLSKISRWYDVEIVELGEGNEQLTFSGSVSRFTPLSGVLKLLEQNAQIRFKLEGKKLIVIH